MFRRILAQTIAHWLLFFLPPTMPAVFEMDTGDPRRRRWSVAAGVLPPARLYESHPDRPELWCVSLSWTRELCGARWLVCDAPQAKSYRLPSRIIGCTAVSRAGFVVDVGNAAGT